MTSGEARFGEERRDASRVVEHHVALVWASSIADHDFEGLFRLGTACLEVVEATPDADRRELLSSVAFTLLVHAGSKDESIGTDIAQLCARELAASDRRAETARVIAELERHFDG